MVFETIRRHADDFLPVFLIQVAGVFKPETNKQTVL